MAVLPVTRLIIITCLLLISNISISASSHHARRNKIELPPPAYDQDFYSINKQQQQLGKLLFFDKIISGNKNTSCATCHHPFTGSSDGLSLPIGEGGKGLSVTRDTGRDGDEVHERVPRNSPHLFNLGAKQFDTMFHDGRIQIDSSQPSGFLNPAGNDLPNGILTTPVAVQAMFPVTSATEMAGQAGENPVANATANNNLAGDGGVWPLLAQRLQAIPEYVELFVNAFDDIESKDDITFAHAGQAIGVFEAATWRCDNSRFDQFLRGRKGALSWQERRGMRLFYNRNKANCAECHSGIFQTDQQFHAIAMPQIGPGKGDNQPGYTDGLDDFGRERVTGDPADRFKFRTPTLRMVAHTGPWGHAGAYNDLEQVVRHHLDAITALNQYDQTQAVLPSRDDLDQQDFLVQNDQARLDGIAAASEIAPINLNDAQVQAIVAFLYSLTDNRCVDMRNQIPTSVPSGLPIAD